MPFTKENMTPSKTNLSSAIRYSRRPLSAYKKTTRTHSYGPATSALLDTQETWNLAYLSHDYEKRLDNADPMFTSYVRRTAQTLLDGSGIDMCAPKDQSLVVGSLLRLPAPRFVYLIRQHPILHKLPLYMAYGDSWLDLIERRSRICLVGDEADTDSAIDNVRDLRQAQAILERIRRV